MAKVKIKYKRILLKLSGEVLQGKKKGGIDGRYVLELCKEIAEIRKLGVEIGIVIGGGNIWRYRDSKDSGIPRVRSDKLGMMATVMNGVALKSAFERLKIKSHVMSGLHISQVAENYNQEKAVENLSNKEICIFVGGTGSPFFTTDSAAALRALETKCDVLLKATKVDGVFDSDPEKNKKAKFFPKLKYKEVLNKNLGVMDLTAISLCDEGNIPIIVFNLNKNGNIKKAVCGQKLGTIIN